MSEHEYHIPNDDAVSADDIRLGADLQGADLSEADLRDADLSGSDLVNATLTDVVLWNATLSDALLSRGTDFDPPEQRLKQYSEHTDSNVLSTSPIATMR